MKYIVAYSKTVWFETELTASSPEEALSKAKHPSYLKSDRWVIDNDSEPQFKWIVTETGENN